VRAEAVEHATNAVLHPWLKQQLSEILDQCPPPPPEPTPGRCWDDWDWHEEAHLMDGHFPPVRVLLVWDNLKGHYTLELVQWCAERGIALLYTPLGGSWLNMTESVQRILVRRALAGQHPKNAKEIMEWLAATVRGWNAAPTIFTWGGKRAERRKRARERRHGLGGSGGYTRCPIRRRHRLIALSSNGYIHDN
jgi:transposase